MTNSIRGSWIIQQERLSYTYSIQCAYMWNLKTSSRSCDHSSLMYFSHEPFYKASLEALSCFEWDHQPKSLNCSVNGALTTSRLHWRGGKLCVVMILVEVTRTYIEGCACTVHVSSGRGGTNKQARMYKHTQTIISLLHFLIMVTIGGPPVRIYLTPLPPPIHLSPLPHPPPPPSRESGYNRPELPSHFAAEAG